jgi:hypothetical protein
LEGPLCKNFIKFILRSGINVNSDKQEKRRKEKGGMERAGIRKKTKCSLSMRKIEWKKVVGKNREKGAPS